MTTTAVQCQRCGDMMRELETTAMPGKGPVIVTFECQRDECKRRAVVMFEPDGGMTEQQATWVEKIVAEKGSFFPNDWDGSGGMRR